MASTWKGIIGTVAPALATALGGPLAGAAVKTIADKVLGTPDASEADVAAAITAGASPDMLLKLKQADQDFARAMADAGIKLEELEAADRANARAREIATKDWVPAALAVTNALAFFILLFLMLSRAVPEANKSAFDILLGMLAGSLTTIMTYYFGSSRGSREKDAILGRVAAK
jgi:hypothetical protein